MTSWGSACPLPRNLPGDQPDHEATERGHGDGGDDEPVGARGSGPSVRRNQEPVVHQFDGLEKDDGCKRRQHPRHKPEHRDRDNAYDETRSGDHYRWSGRTLMNTSPGCPKRTGTIDAAAKEFNSRSDRTVDRQLQLQSLCVPELRLERHKSSRLRFKCRTVLPLCRCRTARPCPAAEEVDSDAAR